LKLLSKICSNFISLVKVIQTIFYDLVIKTSSIVLLLVAVKMGMPFHEVVFQHKGAIEGCKHWQPNMLKNQSKRD
jgi:hypothetical protein